VTQTVTIKHLSELSPTTIKAALDEAGFDIVATPAEMTEGLPRSFSRSLSHLSTLLTGKSRRHIEQCAQCQSEQKPVTLKVRKTLETRSMRNELFLQHSRIDLLLAVWRMGPTVPYVSRSLSGA